MSPQRPRCWKLGSQPMVLLWGGRSFRRWGLVGGLQVIVGVTLKVIMGFQTLPCSLPPRPWDWTLGLKHARHTRAIPQLPLCVRHHGASSHDIGPKQWSHLTMDRNLLNCEPK
jgi:hypothetical protein